MEITVVIPNYNGIKFLRECLMSLAAQDGNTPEFEVVVVDNGSNDQSPDLVEQEFPQARLIALPENTGFCHAVNVGIRASQAPYVILLNNDTKAKEGFVRKLYEAMVSRPDAFSVSARMLMWDKPELLDDAGDQYCVFGWAFARGKGKPAEACGRAAEVFSACGGAAIFRREIFGEIGLFDECHFAYLEDLDIGYRARIYGYRNYYEPGAEVIHYGSASSGSRYNEFKTGLAAANNIYVIGKNMPLLQLIWNLPFLTAGFLLKFLFFCKKRMGILYLKGLKAGFAKVFSAEGRKRRIRFRWAHLGNYLAVQRLLYVNTLRFLKKS